MTDKNTEQRNEGFLIAKVAKHNVSIVVDGMNRQLPRQSTEAREVIDLVKKYNGTRNIDERTALKDKIMELVTPAVRIANATDGRFEFDGKNKMYLAGTKDAIPDVLAKKLKEFMAQDLPLDALVNFWKHLLLNPDVTVREQLYGFISHRDIAITDNGYLVTAKALQIKKKFDKETGEEIEIKEYDENTGELVKREFTSNMEFQPYHRGAHGMIVKVGEPVRMPREECDPDPHRTCSAGLHVGAIEYVKDFGYDNGAILECLVSPRNVVSVPIDYNNTKMRCCEYYPIAITNGKNTAIYLESDYQGIDKAQLDSELAEYIKKKEELISEIENQAEQIKTIAESIDYGQKADIDNQPAFGNEDEPSDLETAE